MPLKSKYTYTNTGTKLAFPIGTLPLEVFCSSWQVSYSWEKNPEADAPTNMMSPSRQGNEEGEQRTLWHSLVVAKIEDDVEEGGHTEEAGQPQAIDGGSQLVEAGVGGRHHEHGRIDGRQHKQLCQDVESTIVCFGNCLTQVLKLTGSCF